MVPVSPRKHKITPRLAGYKELTRTVDVAAGGASDMPVGMQVDPRFKYSRETAEIKIHAAPDDAAVYLDETFSGSVHDFGEIGKSMLISPGKHTIKISLPGCQDYLAEVNLGPRGKFRIETRLDPARTIQDEAAVKSNKRD